MTPRRFLDLASNLGASPGLSAVERRRVRLSNQYGLLAVTITAIFAIAFGVAGPAFRLPALWNLGGCAACLAALGLNAAGRHLVARCLFFASVIATTWGPAVLLGGRFGFHSYFFIFAAVAFVLFDRKQWALRGAAIAATCAGFVHVSCLVPLNGTLGLEVSRGFMLATRATSGLSTVALIAIVVHLFMGDTARAEAAAAQALERSEELLLNILPASISERLKVDERAIADGFGEVSVLFADIVGFTELASRLPPDEVVRMLNEVFSAFDDLTARLGLEKIKTIGDAYMVAAGLPEPRPDHAEAIAEMALAMRQALDELNRARGYGLRLRLGLHSGPVVAGVIGKRKFIYDLWGDTVNTASRMESSGVSGEIQVSAAAAEKLAARFRLRPRGRVAVKGKGEMETFFLEGRREAGAAPGSAAAS